VFIRNPNNTEVIRNYGKTAACVNSYKPFGAGERKNALPVQKIIIGIW